METVNVVIALALVAANWLLINRVLRRGTAAQHGAPTGRSEPPNPFGRVDAVPANRFVAVFPPVSGPVNARELSAWRPRPPGPASGGVQGRYR